MYFPRRSLFRLFYDFKSHFSLRETEFENSRDIIPPGSVQPLPPVTLLRRQDEIAVLPNLTVFEIIFFPGNPHRFEGLKALQISTE